MGSQENAPDIKRAETVLHTCTAKCFGYLWPRDVEDFCDWLLCPKNIAWRAPSPTHHQREPMKGLHISRALTDGLMRGWDRTQRIYVAYEVLRMSPDVVAKHAEGKGGATFTIERLIEPRRSQSAWASASGSRLEISGI